MNITLVCPECRYAKVYSGRGRCRCGAYLIHHSAGTFISPRGRVWAQRATGKWEMLGEYEYPGIAKGVLAE